MSQTARPDAAPPPYEVVARHLARLDARDAAAFVADLWAARGFETRVDGREVVASRYGDSVTLFVADGGRLGRVASPTPPVDVVVAPGGSRRAARLADRRDARFLTAADLVEMLRYAVSADTADALCERHLGATPAALRPLLRTRVLARAAATGRTLRAVESQVGAAAVVVLVVVAVATGVAAFGADDTVSPDATLGAPDSSAPASTEAEPITPWPSRGDDDLPPLRPASAADVPGVDADGVTNLTALAVAHDRALGEQSYTLWLDSYRPANGVPGEPEEQHDTDIAVEGDRYLVRESIERSDDRDLNRAIYYDGTDWYIDDRTGYEPMVRWVDGDEAATSVQPDPRTLRRTLVTRYLATPHTEVTGHVHVGETVRYRIEGEGRPATFAPDEVYNYSFVAFVDERGFVHEATVEFSVITVEGSYRLRFEWTYGQLEATRVTPPAWVDQARPPVESTATATPGNESTPSPTPTATPHAASTPPPTKTVP